MRAGEPRACGFTLPGLLVALAVMLAGAQAAVVAWQHRLQRDREQALIRVGSLYALALERYRARSPGGVQRLPTALEQLVLDTRFVGTERHLRRLYDDPMRPGQPWAVARNLDGEIVGVHSLADAAPIATKAADLRGVALPPANGYAQWVFRVRTAP